MQQTIETIKKRYNEMSPQQKSRLKIVVTLVLIALLFGNKIASGVRRIFHRDIDKIEVNQNNLSYSKGEYYSMCSTLDSAMQGTGTDENMIYTVVSRMNTQDDWNYLLKAFGIRDKDGGTFYADLTGDLKKWLNDDLDSVEMQKVKALLLMKGIQY